MADSGSHTIRKVVIATGEVTTLAGELGEPGYQDLTGTSAEFENPHDVWGDGKYLYVADKTNHVIRRIEITTKVVDTFAGSGTAGFANNADSTLAEFDLPLAVWGDGKYLYVAEGGNHAIRKIDLVTRAVSTLAGSGSSGSTNNTGVLAEFNFPHGMTGDGTYLYVADVSNHTIRRVAIATGEVTTLAGSAPLTGVADGVGGTARFNNPMDIHGDGQRLYVVDGVNDAIRTISPQTISDVDPASFVTTVLTKTFTITGSGFTGGSTVNLRGLGVITGVALINATTIEVTIRYRAFNSGKSHFTVTTDGIESNIFEVSIFGDD